MTEELIHGFSGGLNKDLATSLVQANSYIDANNIRIVTQEGQSSGILMNVLGNEYSLTIPNIGAGFQLYSTLSVPAPDNICYYKITINGIDGYFMVNYNLDITVASLGLDSYIENRKIFITIVDKRINIYKLEADTLSVVIDSTNVPGNMPIDPLTGINDLQMIGWTTIRDTIVLFTCPTIANGSGQIWTVDYNPTSQSPNGPLLKYNQALNFTSKHPIEAVGRYEVGSIQRVYWTDNYNPPRSLNLADVDVASTDIDIVNMTSTTSVNIPILAQINVGGNLLAGSYQYTYRFKKTNGTTSVFAPLSNPVNITEFSENTESYQEYQGSTKGKDCNKSVSYSITNTDNSYSIIEHVFVFKDTYNTVPQIFIYKTDSVVVGTITVQHSKNADTNYVQIQLEELLISTQGDFQRVKTITSKDNMLFFGNTKSDSFSIDLDTRAYRFTSITDNNYARLNDENAAEIYLAGADPQYQIVPSNFDCINPFNTPGLADNDTTSQFKYQKDGITLGGQGPYIKYQFTTQRSIADNVTNATLKTAPFFGADRVDTMQGIPYFTLDSSGQQFQQNNGFYSPKSPYFSSIFTGYARGEIYRFGIVFFDKSGRQSYANWIGDIKFPDYHDVGYEMSYVEGNKTYLKQLGITFVVVLPDDIKSKIQGYSIVRLERPDIEKSKLGTGIAFPLVYPDGELADNKYTSLGRTPRTEPDLTMFKYASLCMVGGSLNFNNYNFKSGDYLKSLGYFQRNTDVTYAQTTNDPGTLAQYQKSTTHIVTAATRFVIDDYKLVGIGEKVPSTFNTALGGMDFANVYNNLRFHGFLTDDPEDEEYWTSVQGVGEIKGLFCLKTDYAYLLNNNGYLTFSINRDLVNQYQGNTFSSRGTNTYISCNHYFPIDKAASVGFDVFNVFGGDTFVNYFSTPLFEFNYGNNFRPPYASENPDNYVAKAVLFPTESSINIDLRQGRHFAKDRDPSNMGAYAFDDFIYNTVYSQQNNTRVFISKPFIDTTQEEFDTRIWYSKPKINGEQTDNWTFIDGYRDVESIYGPINKLTVLNDNLFAFQDRAVANVLVNPLSIIQDNNASNLVLGRASGVIQKHIYLSTEIGTKHQWSVVKSDKGIYWFDILGKRLCKLEGAQVLEISDAKGLISYFQENLKGEVNNVIHNNASGYLIGDSPTYQYGITTGYDYRNKEVVFTFLDSINKFTLSYNEITNNFNSFYSFIPNMYIYTKDKFISPNPMGLNKLYLHNIDGTYSKFYGISYPSDVTIITNKFPANTKVYDNLELFSEVTNSDNSQDDNSSFDVVECHTKYQETGPVPLTVGSTIKRRERSWKLFVPRDTGTSSSSFQARLRDKYLITKLTFNNTGNKRRLLLHWVKVLFRASIS